MIIYLLIFVSNNKRAKRLFFFITPISSRCFIDFETKSSLLGAVLFFLILKCLNLYASVEKIASFNSLSVLIMFQALTFSPKTGYFFKIRSELLKTNLFDNSEVIDFFFVHWSVTESKARSEEAVSHFLPLKLTLYGQGLYVG